MPTATTGFNYNLPNFDWTADYHWATNTTANTLVTDCCSTSYVTQDQIDIILKRLHKIVSEHVKLDITEEEFMDILKE